MKPNTLIIKSLAVLLLGSMALLASCEKNDTDTNPRNPAAPAGRKCTILPPTVTVKPFTTDAPAPRSAGDTEEQERVLSISDDMVNTLILGNEDPQTRASGNDAPQTRATTETTLAAGTYYRIVIYNAADYTSGNLSIVEQRLCKAGSTGYFNTSGGADNTSVTLSEGNYKVFCYSFNTTDPIQLLSLTATSIEGAAKDMTTDFMSAVVDLPVKSTDLGSGVTISNISLQHQLCKVTGTLKADAFSDNTISSSPTPTLGIRFKGYSAANHSWDIAQSAFTGGTLSASLYENFTLVPNNDNTQYSGTLFLCPLDEEQIVKISAEFTPKGASKAASISDAPLSTAGKKITAGHSMPFTVTALGVYELTDTDPVTIGGVQWARTDLKKDFTFQTSPLASGLLKEDGTSVTGKAAEYWTNSAEQVANNDYWRWGELSPSTEIDYETTYSEPAVDTWEDAKDPCRQAGDKNWRLPTKTELEKLDAARLVSKYVKIDGQVAKTSEYGFLTTTGGRKYGCVFVGSSSNVLLLPPAGHRAGNAYQSVTLTARCWSSAKGCYLDCSNNLYDGVNTYSYVVKYGQPIRCVRK